MVKCQVCKESSDKSMMVCEEKDTGEVLQSGKPKMVRKYFHQGCHIEHLVSQEFRKQELIEWDKLYSYLTKLHNIKALDGRMIEKIQDLRNGTVKLKREKVKRYKEGVTYTLMLESYKYSEESIDYALKTKGIDEKWNEFAYAFAIMLSNLDNVNKVQRVVSERNEIESNRAVEVVEINIDRPIIKRKDEMDLSDIL